MMLMVNWEDKNIMTQDEYEKLKADELQEMIDDTCFFVDYLENNFSTFELWSMPDSDKDQIYREYKDYCKDTVFYDDGYEPFEL